VFFWPFLTNWSGGDHFWAPEPKNTRFWPFFHCFWPLFGALFQLRPGPSTTCLIQAVTGVVLMPVLAGLARPAQRPQKGGPKRGPNQPFALMNASKWPFWRSKMGQKWLKKGSFLGPLFDTLLTGYGWYLRQCSIELARAAQDLSKRGPKMAQKVVKKWSILGPLFDPFWTVLAQIYGSGR